MRKTEPRPLALALALAGKSRPGRASGPSLLGTAARTRRRAAFAFMLTIVASAPQASLAQSDRETRLQRGAYLVERAIGCAHCHTPRDPNGRRLPGRDLGGAMMQYTPIKPNARWAPWAPGIAGLPPGYTEAQMATFMETGLKPDGQKARPPMPPFQLHREDAEAIAAYLASMKSPDTE